MHVEQVKLNLMETICLLNKTAESTNGVFNRKRNLPVF